MKISRYPIVFNADSVDLGGFIEQIDPGAVDRTVGNGADVLALFNHDTSKPLGRRHADTLALEKIVNGVARRRVLDMTISEVSLGVAFPAYKDTAQRARPQQDRVYRPSLKMLEMKLRVAMAR
jgi:phage head maturation protease